MPPDGSSPESPRERMVRGAARLMRERGIHGVGMREVVEFSGTPRGSLQRYFPDGKAQLTAEAVVLATSEFPSGYPAAMAADTLAEAVRLALAPWRDQLSSTDFAVGCPLMPIVVDGVDDERLQKLVVETFDAWARDAKAMFERFGFTDQAIGVAFVSATEGAIVLSRAHRNLAALDAVQAVFGSMTAS